MNLKAPAPIKQSSSTSLLLQTDQIVPPTSPFQDPVVLTSLVLPLIKQGVNIRFISAMATSLLRERWNYGLGDDGGVFNVWPRITYQLNDECNGFNVEEALLEAFRSDVELAYPPRFLRVDAETMYAAVPFATTSHEGQSVTGLCISLLEVDGDAKWLFHDLVIVGTDKWHTNEAWHESEGLADGAWEQKCKALSTPNVIPPTPLMGEATQPPPPVTSVHAPLGLSPSPGTLHRRSPDADYWDSYGLTLKQETVSRQPVARSKDVGWEAGEADDNEEDDYWEAYGV